VHLQGDIAFLFGTPEQRVKVVNFGVCKKPPKLIGYYSNVPWATTKLTKVENLVKIGPAVAETYGGICQFLLSSKKVQLLPS